MEPIIRFFYTVLLMVYTTMPLIAMPPITVTSDFSKEQLIGSYIFEKGASQLEAFELTKDHLFSSWLHDRLEYKGTWSLDQSTLYLKVTVYTQPIIMEVISVSGNSLVVRFENLERTATFAKTE